MTIETTDDPTRIDPDLRCPVEFIHVDTRARKGVLKLPPDCSADGRATIRLFERIQPAVALIEVVAGGLPDITYRRVEGRWVAEDHRP